MLYCHPMMGKNKALALLLSPATALVALTVVGLAVRLYEIGARGFWFDEIAFATAARFPTFVEVITYVNEWGDHTPFSFILVWLVRGLGGEEASVRLPFAILGALGVPTLYLLGKTLARPRVGFLAALLYALAPLAVFHGQDAHPYAPLMLFTTLQLLFAYRAATTSRPLDWVGLATFTLLNLYNDYLALAVTAVAATFLGATLLGRFVSIKAKRQPPGQDNSPKTSAQELLTLRRQLLSFIGVAAVVVLFYLPWLPPTLAFLKMPVRTFYSTHTGPATFDDVRVLAQNLGFDMLLVVFLSAGVLYTLLSLWRERRLSSLLLLIWIAGPLAGFWLLTGSRMFLLQTRYYSFLLPAALILIALGASWLASLATPLLARLVNRRTSQAAPAASPSNSSAPAWYVPGAAFTILLAVLLAQAIPALIASYSRSKVVPQDYRGAVARVIDESAPGSIVVSVGMWGLKPAPPPTVFSIQGMEYYLWLYRSAIPYLDASLLDDSYVANLASNDATVWGAVVLPWAMDPQHLKKAGEMDLELIQLEGITLVRQHAPRASPAQQLDTLLAWGIDPQPGLVAIRSLLNPTYKASTLGSNILPPFSNALAGEEQPDTWTLWPNASLAPDASSLVLTSPDPVGETNITLDTRKLTPDTVYVLLFHYRNTQLTGKQRLFLSTYTDSGELIETFPFGVGFAVPSGTTSGSAFAFKVPPKATNARLWLRINGQGTAEFTNVELRPVQGSR